MWKQCSYRLKSQFILEGNRLVLNCRALPHPYHKESDGIRVAIIQAPDFKSRETRWETAVPVFALEDCDRIVTDSLSHIVSWNGKSDLSHLKGKAIYLRFQLKNADLYTIQIQR